MQRQTRRFASMADASDVSQMDPWKDDRCRDFVALNTIQRLRSYHAEAMLPVEPVNSLRAKNLILLPKTEPDAKTCETEEGCAIDRARILFFGPTAFTSLTSQGRMTASPHAGGHSSSRSSFPPSEEMRKSSPVKKVLQTASVPLSSQPYDLGQQRDEVPATPGEGTTENNAVGTHQGIYHDAFEAGATPLRRPINDTTATPAPRPPESATELVVTCDGDRAHEKEGTNSRQSTSGVVKFSCAIVDVIVAYYQSLLTRVVVLDRFNTKDLAFAWWVVGRNMDVAALHHSTGPMRRDSLVILLRHFYYELLNEQRPKKGLVLDSTSSPAHGDKQEEEEEKKRGQSAAAPHKLGEARVGQKPPGGDDGDDGEDEEDTKQQQQAAVATAKTARGGETTEGTRKRPRSRLDSTRTSPPPISSSLRRRLHVKEDARKAKPTEETRATGVPEAVEASAARGSRVKPASRRAVKLKEKVVVGAAVVAQSTGLGAQTEPTMLPPLTSASSSAATKLEPTAHHKRQGAAGGAGAEAPPAERPHRSSRSANLEDIWRPLRSTRRRPPLSESSSDFVEATSAVAEKRHNSAFFLNHIGKRIHARMAKDANYAYLLTAFPGGDSFVKTEVEGHNGFANDGNREEKSLHGMHPALMQLLRYHHAPSPAPSVPRSGLGTGGEEERTAEAGNTHLVGPAAKTEFMVVHENHTEKEENTEDEQRLLPSARESPPARPQDVMTSSEVFVKVECADEEVVSAQRLGPKDENHVSGGAGAPLVQLPCPFSALTYAQRCLLTWEASLLLDPAPTPPVRRGQQPALSTTASQSKASAAQQRHYYNYWSNP
ncbi:hypothetical protein TraAM80_00390 [Trypanosoma rangeli]|uniref:Uncharacterized protein n=1 Tax=Trypanosoma rangeli TaxID=5698 RepID=A0A422P3U2_TRYRA|nr:uncharacterized protein TraAM80_00390 [Trypanosoma rangeli]RNF12378.1 hypothetical protein TraAM80_00390 [Trypanosoma rangeli]|eukprot:RNF12378.1 hypothetical protein TraAM80_00390 [Trypanosoma rangeli]